MACLTLCCRRLDDRLRRVQAAYRVDPLIAEKRPEINQFGADVASPFRQFYRFLRQKPAYDTIILAEYSFPADPSGRKAYLKAQNRRNDRDRFIHRIVARSNELCVAHMSSYVSQQAMNELGLGTAVLGLTAAGSVVSGVGTVQALSAAATGVGGLRSLIDSTIYLQQLTVVLAARAHTERQKLLNKIAAKMAVYSLEDDAPRSCPAGEKLVNLFDDKVRKAAGRLQDLRGSATRDQDKEVGAEEELAAAKEALSEAREKLLICRYWKRYSIDAAIGDLKAFHDACSFYRVLKLAEEDIRERTEEIRSSLQDVYDRAAALAQTSDFPIPVSAEDEKQE